MIDVSDASLIDWDKDTALMRGFTAEPPYVPFADIYLAWHPNGLYLATIGMDYMHPEDVYYKESFPLSESYQLHLLVFVEGQAYHFAVHFMPRDLVFSPDDATNGRGNIALFPYLYSALSGWSPAATIRSDRAVSQCRGATHFV